MTDGFEWRGATELADDIRRGRRTARAALEEQVARIEAYNPRLNAIVTADVTSARWLADAADEAVRSGAPLGALHGVTMTIKDTFDVAGMPSTAGSRELAGRVPAGDAEAVARLKAAGAIVIGRSNTPAYAGDAQCQSELYGTTNNPWDLSRTPGGSSGGAAAAVAAGLVPLELGSDTGGSLRIPAHFCGVATHKPTEGLVPTLGHMPPPPGRPRFPEMLNVVGPIARMVTDLELAMRILCAPPGRATTGENAPIQRGRVHLRWCPDFVTPSDRQTSRLIADAADALQAHGVDMQPLDLAGLPLKAVGDLHPRLVEVLYRSWYMQGSAPSFDELVTLAGERDRYADQVEAELRQVDAWMLPVTPSAAPPHTPKLAPIEVDGVPRDYWDALIADCTPFNVTGHPATSIPIGLSNEGLPIGVQLVGARWTDFHLLELARLIEGVVAFRHHPPLDAVLMAPL